MKKLLLALIIVASCEKHEPNPIEGTWRASGKSQPYDFYVYRGEKYLEITYSESNLCYSTYISRYKTSDSVIILYSPDGHTHSYDYMIKNDTLFWFGDNFGQYSILGQYVPAEVDFDTLGWCSANGNPF